MTAVMETGLNIGAIMPEMKSFQIFRNRILRGRPALLRALIPYYERRPLGYFPGTIQKGWIAEVSDQIIDILHKHLII
jgi:hypothetical protein